MIWGGKRRRTLSFTHRCCGVVMATYSWRMGLVACRGLVATGSGSPSQGLLPNELNDNQGCGEVSLRAHSASQAVTPHVNMTQWLHWGFVRVGWLGALGLVATGSGSPSQGLLPNELNDNQVRGSVGMWTVRSLAACCVCECSTSTRRLHTRVCSQGPDHRLPSKQCSSIPQLRHRV
jgi:hypothetical protein